VRKAFRLLEQRPKAELFVLGRVRQVRADLRQHLEQVNSPLDRIV
jgi:hypothetical protein